PEWHGRKSNHHQWRELHDHRVCESLDDPDQRDSGRGDGPDVELPTAVPDPADLVERSAIEFWHLPVPGPSSQEQQWVNDLHPHPERLRYLQWRPQQWRDLTV